MNSTLWERTVMFFSCSSDVCFVVFRLVTIREEPFCPQWRRQSLWKPIADHNKAIPVASLLVSEPAPHDWAISARCPWHRLCKSPALGLPFVLCTIQTDWKPSDMHYNGPVNGNKCCTKPNLNTRILYIEAGKWALLWATPWTVFRWIWRSQLSYNLWAGNEMGTGVICAD